MTTGFFNRPTQAVINALSAGKQHITEAEVIALTGIKPRLVETTLAEAMELGALSRRRIGNDLVYMLPSKQEAPTSTTISRAATATPLDTRTVAEHTKATATAPAADTRTLAERIDDGAQPVQAAVDKLTQPAIKRSGRRPGTRPVPLPEIDVDAIEITLKPLSDGRSRTPDQTKWGPLFERLAKLPPNGTTYPTAELDKVYGKAIQAAARKYTRDTGTKLKVAIGARVCTVQRVA